MFQQILRMFRASMLRDVFARGHHRIALRRPERDRDHVLRQMFAIAHAGVKTSGHDIDERALADDLEIDFGMGCKKRRNHRRQHQIDRRRRRIDAQTPRRHGPQAAHQIKRRADIRHRGADTGQQQFTGLGKRDAARGAVHQADAEPLLHVAQPLAEARYGDALLDRGAAKIPGARHGDEGIEVAEVEILHCSI